MKDIDPKDIYLPDVDYRRFLNQCLFAYTGLQKLAVLAGRASQHDEITLETREEGGWLQVIWSIPQHSQMTISLPPGKWSFIHGTEGQYLTNTNANTNVPPESESFAVLRQDYRPDMEIAQFLIALGTELQMLLNVTTSRYVLEANIEMMQPEQWLRYSLAVENHSHVALSIAPTRYRGSKTASQ